MQAIDSAWAGSAFSTNGTFRVRQPEFTSLGLLPDGRYRMQFRGSNLTYRVEATTTPEDCGLSVWTPLGAPATTGPDEFEFIDDQAPAHPRRFYRLIWP